MSATHSQTLRLEPVIAYPRKLLLGSTYQMTVDLRWKMEDDRRSLAPTPDGASLDEDAGRGWPYDDEEYEIYCMVQVSDGLSVRSVGEPAVVLHRFGGTYGPAQFLLNATSAAPAASIRVTLVNQWNLPSRVIKIDGIEVVKSLAERPELVAIAEPPAASPSLPKKPQTRSPFLQIDPLDLHITLTPPPADRPDAIAAIALSCGAPLNLDHAGDLLADPLTPAERDDLRWYLEEYWQWPYEQFVARAHKVERLLEDLGARLYDAVFGSIGAQKVLQAWRLAEAQQRQISIISSIPAALSLPWELLHDAQGFLALRARTPVSILRRLPQSESAGRATTFTPPLRVLLVIARPDDAGFIDPRGIARELLDEVQAREGADAIALEFLRPPTLAALYERLSNTKQPPVHVFHFDGHGVFKPDDADARPADDGVRLQGGGQGMLAFENDQGKLDLVRAEALAQVLQDSGVRLAVLTACQSAMSAADDAFSSVAGRLIKGGVDAVVAMSASLLVASATRYVEAFYRRLAEGVAVPLAHERARQALHDDRRRHVHRRRADDEGVPVELSDWWLPHFYQQRPLTLQPENREPRTKNREPRTENRGRKAKRQQVTTDDGQSTRLSEEMPGPPRYEFQGRARELQQIERQLLRGRMVVLHGFGGNGKTALAREAADWLTRTGLYRQALFVSFEHGGDAAALLSALGHFLQVYDGAYNPNDLAAALAKLRPALRARPTLLIADNLESILPGGDAPLPAEERTRLWDILLALADIQSPVSLSPGLLVSSCGILLTTRDTNFGDGRMGQDSRVAHLALAGLSPEDAYALASRLLDDLQIDRARAPYAGLRDLLAQLDHHPLAVQLVLPALRDYPLVRIPDDFAALLDRFVDDGETGRNRSLLASLDYSLRRLTEAQRALLPRLALFEGGASEDDLLAIAEIPEAEWTTLRPALEQAALLRAEQVHPAISVPFLRFHPVLAPFLRSQPGADDPALRQRYAARYHALASYLYREDTRNPQPVRALVRRELPNLRRALGLLLEMGELDAGSDMADRIIMFLNIFGLWRERDEVRRRVDAAVKAADTAGGALMRAEYLRESGRGEDEYGRGDLRAAYARFNALLARIEALPEGAPLGHDSYEHCVTLHRLARCLSAGGQPTAADDRLRAALAIIEALIAQQPDNQSRIRLRGALLTDLGDTLHDQGKYKEAQAAYMEALKVAEQQGDTRQQAVALGQLGLLALQQRDYTEAGRRYVEALDLFRALNEPASEAIVWHQLGRVAQEQQAWAEAERCYRASLAIAEQLGDAAGAGLTCNQLAIVAQLAGRPTEAEGWYRHALEFKGLPAPYEGTICNNLANLLLNETRAGHWERLAEARGYAERALTIKETLDLSAESWLTLDILAGIAEMEGRADAARDYRRRERATFAAFAGNRWHIDRQHGRLIAAIVAAARGDEQARAAVEQVFPQMEAGDWGKVPPVIRRIWAGEREWEALVEEIDRQDALLVLRVLEELEGEGVSPSTTLMANLPAAVRSAQERGDPGALAVVVAARPQEQQESTQAAPQQLQSLIQSQDDPVMQLQSLIQSQDDPVMQLQSLIQSQDDPMMQQPTSQPQPTTAAVDRNQTTTSEA